MASSMEQPLDHRYRGEHPVRTLAYLFQADRGRLAAAVGVFTVKHSPIWLLPLITASIIDTVVQHGPVGRLWTSTGIRSSSTRCRRGSTPWSASAGHGCPAVNDSASPSPVP
ncbi:hypothetical protein AB0O67_27130 [Streptomyces sp. NPDC086077]|uniref:hypothetical protein n=1 Tax=Streptomyces sp. NPDC086077 TaxID=3154862 RepID=UPI00343E09F7